VGEIQAFTEEHAEDAASLYLRAVRGQNRAPGKRLPEYFRQLHLANPWVSPDMPPLVYLEKGKVIGALGVIPRAMEFRGRPIMIATASIYMVDPEYRNGPAAIQLLRRMLKGPQEFSWSDGASGNVGALWKAMGGHADAPYAFNWIRILRPLGTARMGLDRIGRAGKLLKPLSGLLTAPGDYLISKAPLDQLKAPVSTFSRKQASAGELLACIKELGWREDLKPLYTDEAFDWLVREAAANTAAALRLVIVLDQDGKPAGWFIYYAAPGNASFVLQMGVRAKDDFRNTLLALFRDAWEQGSACVKGAAIPQHLTAMTELGCIFRHPHDRVVFHSRNAEIANAVRTGDAAITRLDGIGWLRFAWEQWDQ